jgi:predicted transcriptional regulator
MEPQYIVTAQEMLPDAPLPPELVERLDRAAELTQAAGGLLVSRQAIAAIIVAWEHE